MSTPRVYPAHSLEIVVSTGQTRRAGQIIAATPGHVDVHEAGPQWSGWVRLILTTDAEQHLHDLQTQLREGLDFPPIHCEDRVLALSRGGKTQTRVSVPLDTAEDLALADTPGVGRVASRLTHAPERVNELTGRANRLVVVTDGPTFWARATSDPSRLCQ